MRESSGGGIGFGMALFLLFLALKLAHVIAWSWWWVTAPLWLPVAILFAGLGFLALLASAAEHGRESGYEQDRKDRQRAARKADKALYDEWGQPRG